MQRALATAILFSSLVFTSSAFAATFLGDETLTVSSPIWDDVYAAGSRITIDKPVHGDLIAVGGNIRISAPVDHDIAVAGGNITIEGDIGDDARIAGGDVVLRSSVAGDVLLFGGNLEVAEGAIIGGDLVVYGGSILLGGEVKGSLRAGGDDVSVLGPIDGNANIMAENVQMDALIKGDVTLVAKRSLQAGDNASFEGTVRYAPAGIAAQVKGIKGGADAEFDASLFSRIDSGVKKAGIGALFAGILGIFFVSGLLVIILLLLLTKSFFADAAKFVRTKPWQSLGYGFLFVIVAPIAGVILLMTLVGIPVGIAVLACFALMLLFSKPMAAVVIARVAEQHWKKKRFDSAHHRWNFWMLLLLSALAYTVLKFLMLLPVVGWIIDAIVILMTLGAVMTMKYRRFLKVR